MSCWLGKILCYEDSFSVLQSYLVVKQTIYCNHSERVSAIEISIICDGNIYGNDKCHNAYHNYVQACMLWNANS